MILEIGELLCFYTDGTVEAVNPEGEVFGYDRLKAFLLEKRGGSAREIVETFMADLTAFADGVPFGDDVTISIVKRVPLFSVES